jgi:hypothetical protein
MSPLVLRVCPLVQKKNQNTKRKKMKALTKAKIVNYLIDNYEEVVETISKAVVRDSVYSTLVYWDGDSVQARHGEPGYRVALNIEEELGTISFDSPSGLEDTKENVASYLEDLVNNTGVDTSDSPVLEKIIQLGISALAAQVAPESADDPEGIREAADQRFDESFRTETCERFVDVIISDLREGIANHLKIYRQALDDEDISTGEILELQGLKEFIRGDDIQLLIAAGVPEFLEEA